MNQHIKKILYKSNYQINETPKYKLVELINGEQDTMPISVKEAEGDEQIPAQETPPTTTPAPAQPEIAPTPTTEPTPQELPVPAELPQPEVIVPPTPVGPTVDDIQNDVIRMNIDAMRTMHAQMLELSNEIESLKGGLKTAEKEVESLKQPTPGERLVNKKHDSAPFNYNLNDLWKGNYFQSRRDEFNERGIRKLDDGTYIADFDDLPVYSASEIRNTYN